jgi:hypothetical protein
LFRKGRTVVLVFQSWKDLVDFLSSCSKDDIRSVRNDNVNFKFILFILTALFLKTGDGCTKKGRN